MSAAVHTLKVRRIWGDIQSFIYPIDPSRPDPAASATAVETFRQRLRAWWDEVPVPDAENSYGVSFGSNKWFLLSYHHSILLLHRGRLVKVGAEAAEPSPELTAVYLECADSAATICRTYQELYMGAVISTTWGALHVLFLGGLTFLHCLWTSKAAREAYRKDHVSSICTACTIVLVVMAERWSAAAPYRDTFNALAAATQSMLVEEEVSHRVPSLPAIDTRQQGDMAKFLSNIEEVGMCDSVEHLLGELV